MATTTTITTTTTTTTTTVRYYVLSMLSDTCYSIITELAPNILLVPKIS